MEQVLEVTLRPLSLPDAEVIAQWAADPEFCRQADWSSGVSLEERRRRNRALIQSPPSQLIRLGAVHDGVLIGYVDLHGDEPERRELGFVIGERHRWGRGLGGLAAAAGLDFGFDRLGLRLIWAEALDANPRSISVLRRLGMAETGRGADVVFLGRPTHHRQFAITAVEWAAIKTPR